jgi:PAS domain S-box-containing protein
MATVDAGVQQGVWRYVAGVIVALVLPFAFWPSLLTRATSSDFLPHRYCYLNDPLLVGVSVVSDAVIALCYLAISATLALLVHRVRRTMPFSWMLLAFGLFIVACGGTHLMDAVTVWKPFYWLSADVKIVTAMASLVTAISFPMVVPRIISLLAAHKLAGEQKVQLEAANAQLVGQTYRATARLAAIVEGSDDAITGYTLDGVITDWNRAATRLYGYTAGEAVGNHLFMLVPPSLTGEIRAILSAVAQGERIRQTETVRQKKDGTINHVSFSASPIVGQNGGIIGGSMIVRDITSRRGMEESLRSSEERFRLVVEATKDVIWDWDIKSGKVWRSEIYWEHFGYPPKATEPDVTSWKELIHPEDRDRVWHSFQRALSLKFDSFDIEYRFQKVDGSYAIILDRALIVYDEAGEPERAIGAITDLSDRRELEEQFRQAQKMEAVGRLAGGVAHDFNNILMVITAYTEMIRDKIHPEDELQKSITQVKKAADRATALTQQLLAFSRRQVLMPRVIDLNAVIDDSVKMIQRLIGEDIDLNIALGKPLWAVKTDPGQVVQVLMNLCVNSRDAMEHGGEVRILTENLSIDVEEARKRPALLPGNYVALVVSDSGTGMTKEVQFRLFEPFFTTKESGRGTGLGLSTVYGIVKQSGGYIWVESEVGRGSTFTVYFPAVDAPLTTTMTPEVHDAEGQGETILVVEDDEALRSSISAYLKLHGYKVLQAPDGVQARQIATQYAESIDVLITDIILPKLSGTELARQVGKIYPQVVTLYMSGYMDRELIGFDPASLTTGLLQKPFALQALLQKLREMVTQRKEH